MNQPYQSVQWKDGTCVLLDQRRLPSSLTHVHCETVDAVVEGIRTLTVRGAPAIGIAGAYGAALALGESNDEGQFVTGLARLGAARPTAVNLSWALNRSRARWEQEGKPFGPAGVDCLVQEAHCIVEEEVRSNVEMARLGADRIDGRGVAITYCNTGPLATAGVGTALGVLIEAHRQGKIEEVLVPETRPLLQGMRLTAWELAQHDIPFRVICDNQIPQAMARQRVVVAAVGADRVAANGDAANKIGTYGLAVLAHTHDCPFFVVAPSSTFDLSLPTGAQIPIEERAPAEVLGILGDNAHPNPVAVGNPAFDVTPAKWITALVCERGVIQPPNADTVAEVVQRR